MAHPVLGIAGLVRALLYDQPPSDFFRPGSLLHETLASEPLELVAPPLREGLIRNGKHDAVAALHAEMTHRALPFPHDVDLAYGKPALISSTSPWSRDNDPRLDANGANGAILNDICAFHTDRKSNPWWQVDLLEDCVIERIEIVNRVTMSERFLHFVVEQPRQHSLERSTSQV